MTRKTPTVWVAAWGAESVAELQLPDQSERRIRLDTAAWLAWLELATTLSFAYPVYDGQVGYIRGFLTVRKETRARGSQYWVAYRRTGGRLRKIYLGRAAHLTHQQLATTAERFLALERATLHGRLGTDGQKEVKSGQLGGVSLEWGATPRRMERGYQLVAYGR